MNRRRSIEQSRNRTDRALAARWLARERVRAKKRERKRALLEALHEQKETEDGARH
jgi:hypothetical protein